MTAGGDWIAALRPRLAGLFGASRDSVVAAAPGRVNLIGEHTDYNDGWVLPMAIDRRVAVAGAPRSDGVLRAHSERYNETRSTLLDRLAAPGGTEWFDYIAGTAWALQAAGHRVAGADLVVNGDVPPASGLSSSAALEMATARVLCELSGSSWDPVPMALLGQRTEGEYIGVKGGVMDQFTAVMGEAGRALLLDCRSLEATAVALPASARVVVMDTGAPRTLAGSAYNDRSAACRAAVSALRGADPSIRALRDVDLELLESQRGRLDEVVYRRARHVVEENPRPAALAAALEGPDLGLAGALMDESHASLRDLYEVSSAELDLVTGLARQHPACFGARLTGAGFGGCAIALVAAGGAESFVEDVGARYRQHVDLPGAVFAVRAEAGAGLV